MKQLLNRILRKVLNMVFRNVDRDCRVILAPGVPSSPVYIGFLVHSAPTHLEQRNRYRYYSVILVPGVLCTSSSPAYIGFLVHSAPTHLEHRNRYRYYSVILVPGVLCTSSSPVYIGFLVHSAPTHLEHRNRYRYYSVIGSWCTLY